MEEAKELELFSRLLAVQAGVIALIRTLPSNPNLPVAVQQETERVLAMLLPMDLPDSAMDAFHNQIQTIQKAADKYHSK